MKNFSNVHGPIVEQCGECLRPVKREPYAWQICPDYSNPEGKWSQGLCNHALIPKEKETDAVKRAKKAKTQKASEKVARGSLHLRKYEHKRSSSKKKYVDYVDGVGLIKKGSGKR